MYLAGVELEESLLPNRVLYCGGPLEGDVDATTNTLLSHHMALTQKYFQQASPLIASPPPPPLEH